MRSFFQRLQDRYHKQKIMKIIRESCKLGNEYDDISAMTPSQKVLWNYILFNRDMPWHSMVQSVEKRQQWIGWLQTHDVYAEAAKAFILAEDTGQTLPYQSYFDSVMHYAKSKKKTLIQNIQIYWSIDHLADIEKSHAVGCIIDWERGSVPMVDYNIFEYIKGIGVYGLPHTGKAMIHAVEDYLNSIGEIVPYQTVVDARYLVGPHRFPTYNPRLPFSRVETTNIDIIYSSTQEKYEGYCKVVTEYKRREYELPDELVMKVAYITHRLIFLNSLYNIRGFKRDIEKIDVRGVVGAIEQQWIPPEGGALLLPYVTVKSWVHHNQENTVYQELRDAVCENYRVRWEDFFQQCQMMALIDPDMPLTQAGNMLSQEVGEVELYH